MAVRCVVVEREAGEQTRHALAEAGYLRDDVEIVAEDGHLYIPVTAAATLDDYEVVHRELPDRKQPTMPADILGDEPAYERLGDIAIIDEDDPAQAEAIADAIVAADLPVETVINRASKIKGELRIRDWKVLRGTSTETVHREYGHEFLLDVAEVYFSPRLATDRHRVIEQVSSGEHVVDMFAGVGPFAIPMAARGAEVVAVDLNPRAIDYLEENARRNDVSERITAICGDITEVASEYEGWADRLVMNLPHNADEFLEAAMTMASDDCLIHYYDIQSVEDRFGPGERAIRAKAEPAFEVTVESTQIVRSYAPDKDNVRLDVRLRRN